MGVPLPSCHHEVQEGSGTAQSSTPQKAINQGKIGGLQYAAECEHSKNDPADGGWTQERWCAPTVRGSVV